MGLGSSSPKKLIGTHITLHPKVIKDSKVPKKYEIEILHGTLIDSKNGIHYLELDDSSSMNEDSSSSGNGIPQVIAIAASEYEASTEPMDVADNAEMAAEQAEMTAEAAEASATAEAEPVAAVADKGTEEQSTITEEGMKKGGKSRKSRRKKKQRRSRKVIGTYGSSRP